MKLLFTKLFNNRSISKVFMTTMLAFTLILLLILGGFWLSHEKVRFQQESQRIRAEYIENQQKILQHETQTLLNFIENERSETQEHLKQDIREKVYEAYEIADKIYKNYKGKLSTPEIKELITSALKGIRFNEGNGYFYINTFNGKSVLDPQQPRSAGKTLLHTKDVYGTPIVQREIEIAKKQQEGFTQFSWEKNEDQKIHPKISFVKAFQPFKWYIGCKEFIDTYNRSTQKELLKKITDLRFNDKFSIMVLSFDGTCLANTNQELVGKNLWNIEDGNQNKITQEIITRGTDPEGGFINFQDPFQNEGGNPAPKMIYAKSFKEWQWVIGAGIYMNEIEESIAAKKEELEARVNQYILNVILVLVGASLIIILMSRYIFRISRSGLEIFTRFFDDAATDSTLIETDNLFFKEFKSLAISANHMIKRRKITEHRLNVETAYFEQLFENSPEAIAITDNESKGIKINRQFTKVFGYTIEDIQGIVIDKFLADDSKMEEAARLTSATTKGQLIEIETQRKCKDGTILDVSIMGNPIVMDGKQIAIFGIYRDITQRKQYEKHLKSAKERAEESDKLKSAFLANMSHEIRTPMNHILGFTDFLVMPGLTDEDRNEYASLIKESGGNLLELINNIVDLSKIEAKQITLKKKECCVNHILSFLYEKYYDVKNRNGKQHLILKVQKALNDEDSIIRTDPERFEQLFSSLIDNAIKFTESGSVEFGYYLLDKQTVQFYVKDTGIGISENDQKDIFKSFRQIDGSDTRKFGGTGLGLTIAHRLVELFGGNIWVESEVNKGSCFHFTLPYGQAQKSTPIYPLDAIEAESYQWRNKNILVVDDERNNFTFFKAALNDTNAHILWAKNGEEAVQMCQTNTIDIILMDIQMPKMNGYEATREIKLMDNNIPIIGQTAYAQKEHKEKVLAAGCDDYLSKPIRSSVLLESIKKHMSMN